MDGNRRGSTPMPEQHGQPGPNGAGGQRAGDGPASNTTNNGQHAANGGASVGPRQFGFDTRAIHAGQRPDPYTGARAMPIYQTTSFVFEDTDSAAAYFNLQEYG